MNKKKTNSLKSGRPQKKTLARSRKRVIDLSESKKVVEPSYPKHYLLLGVVTFFFSYVLLSLLSHYWLLYFLDSSTSSGTSVLGQNKMGMIGELISMLLSKGLGITSFLFTIGFPAVIFIKQRSSKNGVERSGPLMFGSFGVLITSSAILLYLSFGSGGGGILGSFLAKEAYPYLNTGGIVFLSLTLFLTSTISLCFNSWGAAWQWLRPTTSFLIRFLVSTIFKPCRYLLSIPSRVLENRNRDFSYDDLEDLDDDDFCLGDEPDRPSSRKIRRIKPLPKDQEVEEGSEFFSPPKILRDRYQPEKHKVSPEVKETRDLARKAVFKKYPNYKFPERELLVGVCRNDVSGPDDEELFANSRKLEEAFNNFKLGGRVVEVHPGPVITLYQFEPAAGIKVQRVINLADDLALALKVESVRVYAPVPGKGTIGIEVPNSEREIVRLRDLIDSDDYINKPYSLPLALGKDTYGKPFVSDLTKMPHLLIAGATGTGKSVCINSLLMSLLFNNSPEQLRLILIDPKMLELSVYEGMPHLLSPVITNPKRARGVLYWAVEEMERRYSIMKKLGVRDLAMYNKKVSGSAPSSKLKKDGIIDLNERDVVATASYTGSPVDRSDSMDYDSNSLSAHAMPRIVIVVDEMADLMLTVGKEIEELLTRLAQKARAAGIHLILATQRPSVNVITGLIKANFPARISFKVTSKIDARTILDQSGSERLLGQGDMLFLSPNIGRICRLHSPFVSDQEVHDIANWIRSQGAPNYDPEIEKSMRLLEEQESQNSSFGGSRSADLDEVDPLYDEAVSLVIEKGTASTSMVQRVFRIGYNRAARILETMEREGVVGGADGSKKREVLVGQDQ